MNQVSGVGVSAGRVVGTVLRMAPPVAAPPEGERLADGTDAAAEAARIKDAAAVVKTSLQERAATATGDSRKVLEATAMMAADPALTKDAAKRVTDSGVSAARAVWDAAEKVAAMLKSLGGYMAERANDIYDVRSRIVAELRGEQPPGVPTSSTPFVLVAVDLAPADTATLDPALVQALVTSEGGPQSHTAILARQLGLPAIVAAHGADAIAEGTEVFVDGAAGTVSLEVGDTERQYAATWAERAANPSVFNGVGALSDGFSVPLLANIGNAKDAKKAAAANAEGVGLFRTEFLFLDRADEPPVDEQEKQYAEVFAEFPGKKVVIRTLDAGADKPLPFVTDDTEPNPALGVRGYRTSWRSPEVLTNQLTAIARAADASEADVWVMAPMIATAAESADFAQQCTEAGIKRPGIMIEIPAAALTADKLLTDATFASIGTNDLTQYTMAADRQLGSLAELNDPWQPGLLALVKASVDGATTAGEQLAGGATTSDDEHHGDPIRPVGVCGEAAGDPALAVVLVGLGVSTLSMTPRSLANVAEILASVSREDARRIARIALDAPSAADAKAGVRAEIPLLEELGL
ncbi:phosphoenolpyruvate--protein phosphotransferase [Tersicoccus phoenicis]|uniref:Phosphoenolpyruvate-protein phosphotransferase n=1 Tax=Tersicoccus phoenicis TaxID=554083 RepID=A0A1R1LP75_9MICC|nr:phosphoenolpyruvate--protein phosphotransferase [Tersicoccus phoenicis]OMH29329.1 phosphoenolpyruvate--protein phosphotransferase [Tersicoccus phoenicis]